ncbi:MAG: hypothetical protein FWE23_05655 [Chitinivibrionia bacterium]|nr:hypothetical protein [Chitinivibrionia bacterium]
MVKLSFKIQLLMVFITVAVVVAITITVVRQSASDARDFDLRARQSSDLGIERFYEKIAEKAMDFETGAIILDSIGNFLQFSGQTEEGRSFSVNVIKNKITADSIRIRIESRGTFGNTTDFQVREIFLFSPDTVNWFPETR